MESDAVVRGFEGSCGLVISTPSTGATQLRESWGRATSAWPDFSVGASLFGRALAERVDSDNWLPAVAEFPVEDLYLVLGCASGAPNALRALEEQFFGELRPAVAQLGAPRDVIDDVLGDVRERLLVPADGGDPRILQFRGQSSLLGWLKVIVVREGLATLRRRRIAEPQEAELDALMASCDDLEFAEARERYRGAFRRAFAEALNALTPTQRTVLRQHLLDQLSIDAIGRLHSVHRSTAARWLVNIRQSLFERTRVGLLEELELASGEFEGVMGLVRSQLDFSVGRFLEADEPAPPAGSHG